MTTIASLLESMTAGTFNVCLLRGDKNKNRRRMIAEKLAGRQVYAKECAINALEESLFKAFGVSGDQCDATKRKHLAEALKAERESEKQLA